MTVHLHHNQVELALHELRGGEGRPLLLLHALGGRSPPLRRSRPSLDGAAGAEEDVPRYGHH